MLTKVTTRVQHFGRRLLVGMAIAALALSMAACTASSSASLDSSAQARRLALGTLRLEGTPQAVDSQLAAQLLPLWQLMEELSANSAAAPQEISAVVDKIRSTMTTAQVGAIDDMTLSASDTADPTPGGDTSTASGSAGGGGMPMEAVVGGGGPPEGGGGIPGGGGMPPGRQAGSSGSSSANATTTASSGVYEQVISLLRSKLQGAPAS
jgi:hypothetical protein